MLLRSNRFEAGTRLPPTSPPAANFGRNGEPGLRKYMQTGLTPKGGKSDAPMPTYKLSAEDADAVLEYLKTLK